MNKSDYSEAILLSHDVLGWIEKCERIVQKKAEALISRLLVKARKGLASGRAGGISEQ